MRSQTKTLENWLSYIELIHPESIELGLERVNSVFKKMFPEGLSYPVITVAGTNGKGSCCAYIEAILQAANLKIGKYTSPHLVSFNERIVVGTAITDNDLIIAAFEKIEIARGEIVLTYFEYTTLAAMIVFTNEKIDIGVFEVGLGGRLDAVNILNPIVSIITSISVDHIDWLGDDRGEIGLEKAAIARPERHCIVGELDVPDQVKDYLQGIGALPSYIGDDFDVIRDSDNWSLVQGSKVVSNKLPNLKNGADHQYRNAACAVMAVYNANIEVSSDAVNRGLLDASVTGRCQLLSLRPLIILDVAHNEDSVLALREYIDQLDFIGKCYAVFSMLSDKDVNACVELMFDTVDEWNIAPLDSVRSSSVESLSLALNTAASHRNVECFIHSYTSIQDAFNKVKNAVNSDDCVIVFGSFHVVGDILLTN